MKTFLGWAALVALASQAGVADIPASVRGKKPAGDAVVATVGSEKVTAAEVEDWLWDWRQEEVVRDIAEDRLILQAAKGKFGAGTEEVQAAMDELFAGMESQLEPGKTVQQILDDQGMTPSRIWMRVRREVLIRKMILADFEPKEWVRVSTLIVRPNSTAVGDVKKSIERAEAFHKRLVAGESWDSVLAQAQGGTLGWRRMSAFPEGTQAEMGRVGVGKFTQPAQTQNGIQIFRVEALGASVTPEQRKELEQTIVAARRAPFLKELRDKTKIEIVPVKRG